MTLIEKVEAPAGAAHRAGLAATRPLGGFFGAVGRAIGAAIKAHDAWEARIYPDGLPETDVIEQPHAVPESGYDWMRAKLQAEYDLHGRCSYGSGRVLTDREMAQYGIRR